MGATHHVVLHGEPLCGPVLLGGPAEYVYSFNQSLLSKRDVDDSREIQKVQQTMSSSTTRLVVAFALLEQSSELPSVESLTCLLLKCIERKTLVNARRAYMHILANGLDMTSALGQHLLQMFVECGSISSAQQVFHRLAQNNVHAWTYLIQASVTHGDFHQAFYLFELLESHHIHPDKCIFQALFKACISTKNVGKGRELHSEIVKEGYDMDPFIGSVLLDMYAKSGLIGEAALVFKGLLVKDVVCWTALLSGFAENGLNEEALRSFENMQLEGIYPNDVTFICVLKSCGTLEDIGKGREIHMELVKEGFEEDLCVGSALVSMYVNCGSMSEAREVFNELPHRDVVSWTAIIGGYAEHGFAMESLNSLVKMQADGWSPNAVTSVYILKACGSLGLKIKGRWIHMEIIKKGFDDDFFINTALVDMYIKCTSFAEAQDVFDKLPLKSLVLWNALLTGLAEHKCGQEALTCFERMQSEGLFPDAVTFVCTLKACGSSGHVGKGQLLHAEIAKYGFEEDPDMGISLLDMYSKCGLLNEAQEVFNNLPVRDVVAWNVLIMGYTEQGLGEKALVSLKLMHQGGVPLDAITAACSLKACVTTGALDMGRWIHLEVVKYDLVEDPIISNALVDVYAKGHSLLEARWVFDSLSSQGVVIWGTLLTGYAYRGEAGVVFRSFDEMIENGIQPDAVTFLSVLSVCCHVGMVEKGFKVLIAMREEYGFHPTIKHHNCMIDILSRAGQLHHGVALINRMPFQPNIVTWSTLLGSCRKYGDIELAKEAFECAASLKENKATSFILMASIYANNNMWEDIEQLEEMVMNL